MKLLKSVAIAVFVFIFISVCVMLFTNEQLDKESLTVNKKEKAVDVYSASLTFCRIFKKCDHTVADSSFGTVTFSSTEELLNRFPGYKITSGEADKIVLSAEIDNFCPAHYKAVLKNDEITVTRIFDGGQVTSFKTAGLSLSVQEKSLLEQGITLDSKKALASFIEDFTS